MLLAYNINTGQRHLRVTATKTKADYTRFMDWVVATRYPDVPTIKLVQDNYSTHTYGDFYEHLPVGRARAAAPPTRVSLYPQIRLLSQQDRNRVLGSFPAVPEPTHWQRATTRRRSPGLASQPKRGRHQNLLVFHH